MATDFGRDLWCQDDLDPTMREVEGVEGVMQAAHGRLITPRGQLLDDPDYGDEMARFLSEGVTPEALVQIPGAAAAEILKDERIDTASGTVVASDDGRVEVALDAFTAEGPFRLTFELTATTLTLLKGETS